MHMVNIIPVHVPIVLTQIWEAFCAFTFGNKPYIFMYYITQCFWERSGSVVECLT